MRRRMNDLLSAAKAWDAFRKNHPKFPAFMSAVKRSGVREGTLIEIRVTSPEGETIESNLKVQESDLDFLRMLGRYGMQQ